MRRRTLDPDTATAERRQIDGFRGRLKRAREAHGLSQEKLARLVRAEQAQISGYECGKFSPSVPMLAALAEVLGSTMDDLWRGPKTKGTPRP